MLSEIGYLIRDHRLRKPIDTKFQLGNTTGSIFSAETGVTPYNLIKVMAVNFKDRLEKLSSSVLNVNSPEYWKQELLTLSQVRDYFLNYLNALFTKLDFTLTNYEIGDASLLPPKEWVSDLRQLVKVCRLSST